MLRAGRPDNRGSSETVSLPHSVRLALGPTQPFIHYAPGLTEAYRVYAFLIMLHALTSKAAVVNVLQ
jgi:hypothetical protein